MISEDDMIYIVIDDNYKLIGDGYSSKDEIIQMIKSQYKYEIKNGVSIEFGICNFSKESDTESESASISTQNNPLNDEEVEILDNLIERAENDPRIKSSTKVDYTACASKYTQTIRYENEVDFKIKVKRDLFDDIPVSMYDRESVKKIKQIFSDIVKETEGTYLGFDSSYGARGRRSPYIAIYGRINRDNKKESQFRDMTHESFVIGHYWTDNNLSPVPIYYDKELDEDYGFREQDYILILNATSNDTEYKSINDTTLESVYSMIDTIVDKYDYRVDWIGKVNFKKNFDQICLGVSYLD